MTPQGLGPVENCPFSMMARPSTLRSMSWSPLTIRISLMRQNRSGLSSCIWGALELIHWLRSTPRPGRPGRCLVNQFVPNWAIDGSSRPGRRVPPMGSSLGYRGLHRRGFVGRSFARLAIAARPSLMDYSRRSGHGSESRGFRRGCWHRGEAGLLRGKPRCPSNESRDGRTGTERRGHRIEGSEHGPVPAKYEHLPRHTTRRRPGHGPAPRPS